MAVPLNEKYKKGDLIEVSGAQHIIIAINREQGTSYVIDNKTDEVIEARLDQALFLVPADQFEF